MRVIEIINALTNRGGAEVMYCNLCASLNKIQDVELLSISLHSFENMSFLDTLNLNGVKHINLNKKNGLDLKCAKKLKEIIQAFKPDIIHMHLSCLPTYFLAFGFKKTKWKLIQTIHSIPGYGVDKITNFLRRQYIKKKLLSFVGITNSITDDIKKLYCGVNCNTVYNGTKLFNPCFKKENPLYDFVIVASMTKQKNHRLLFDAISKLADLGYLFKVACVGDGPFLDEYKKLISEKRINDFVSFLGKTDNVYEKLKISKCFILTSIVEGNPISVLEAMDFGMPLILPNVGGIPDIVEHEVNALLFDKNDLQKLIENMIIVLEGKYDNQMIINNHKLVKKFSIEECASNYYLLFRKEIYGK